MILHEHPFAAFCWKPLIALYELDLPFERWQADDRAELAAIWPPAKIPVLQDGALIVPESSTIVEHIDDGRLIPADRAQALQARIWDRFHDHYVAVPMQKVVGDALRAPGEEDPAGVREARSLLDTAYATLEQQLTGRAWTAGDRFTLADCAAAPALHYAWIVHPWDTAALPELTRYHRALMQRPSVARVIDEARPFRSLFPLPWPDHADV